MQGRRRRIERGRIGPSWEHGSGLPAGLRASREELGGEAERDMVPHVLYAAHLSLGLVVVALKGEQHISLRYCGAMATILRLVYAYPVGAVVAGLVARVPVPVY